LALEQQHVLPAELGQVIGDRAADDAAADDDDLCVGGELRGHASFYARAGVGIRPLCYGVPAGTTAGDDGNERSTPCPAENAASGATPARRRWARGLEGDCENDRWTPCPAEEGFTTEDTEHTEEGCLRAARAGLGSAL